MSLNHVANLACRQHPCAQLSSQRFTMVFFSWSLVCLGQEVALRSHDPCLGLVAWRAEPLRHEGADWCAILLQLPCDRVACYSLHNANMVVYFPRCFWLFLFRAVKLRFWQTTPTRTSLFGFSLSFLRKTFLCIYIITNCWISLLMEFMFGFLLTCEEISSIWGTLFRVICTWQVIQTMHVA